ncbi:uncharacterized protein LOC131281265 [Anopheles ziemanni]|uniref:uncharacterized protein LOC131266949 n=1 Tax=Anopheles coustani TaxID=139045 RepID=UPI00265AF871|nr:uncharacterized protein LOC131266949 [Anopheles coustani]XP_058166522.1 uncharacterized protein LOC131281265 [Anopheles ziemanni]
MNDAMMIKCEPIIEDVELFNTLVADGETQRREELRMLCMYKLKVAEETVSLLEAQGIDMECLRKMRIEDVDELFDGKPLGAKILFREAFLEWRDEIGLPCKSIKSVSSRKRPSDTTDCAQPVPPKRQAALPHWNNCLPPQSVIMEKEPVTQCSKQNVSYQSFRWPMTPSTLKEILDCNSLGRSIMAMGCLGGLGKSLQYQLTAIIIDYHMEFEAKITTPQLENYAYCIATLFPHENPLTYHIPRGPNRRNPGGSLYSRFINQKISKKALAIGSSVAAS